MRKNFVLLIVSFLFLIIVKSNAIAGVSTDTTTIKVRRLSGQLPHLGFACELDPVPLHMGKMKL